MDHGLMSSLVIVEQLCCSFPTCFEAVRADSDFFLFFFPFSSLLLNSRFSFFFFFSFQFDTETVSLKAKDVDMAEKWCENLTARRDLFAQHVPKESDVVRIRRGT